METSHHGLTFPQHFCLFVKSFVLQIDYLYNIECEVNILILDPSVTYSDKLRNRDGREMTGKKTVKCVLNT